MVPRVSITNPSCPNFLKFTNTKMNQNMCIFRRIETSQKTCHFEDFNKIFFFDKKKGLSDIKRYEMVTLT